MMNLSDTDQAPYSAPAPQTATVSDEAVQAYCQTYYKWWNSESTADVHRNIQIPGVREALTAALPHLALSAAPCSVEVKKLTWVNTKPETNDVWLCPENHEYEITRWWLDDTQDECGHFEVSELDEQQFGALEEAKAAAQADFERRILSQIVTKPVDVAAVRKQAFEEAAQVAEIRHEKWSNGDGFHDSEGLPAVSCDVTACENIASAIRTLSPAEPVDQWQDIATAPKDWSDILLYVPDLRSDHRNVCEGFYYVEQEEWRSVEFGVLKPTHWMPLPAAPTSKGGE